MNTLMLALIVSLLFTGCAMPGSVKTAKSSYDGSTHVVMQPAWAAWNQNTGSESVWSAPVTSQIFVGASANSLAGKEKALLTIQVRGTDAEWFSPPT